MAETESIGCLKALNSELFRITRIHYRYQIDIRSTGRDSEPSPPPYTPNPSWWGYRDPGHAPGHHEPAGPREHPGDEEHAQPGVLRVHAPPPPPSNIISISSMSTHADSNTLSIALIPPAMPHMSARLLCSHIRTGTRISVPFLPPELCKGTVVAASQQCMQVPCLSSLTQESVPPSATCTFLDSCVY